jgi:UDP-galactopyranose mutase
MEIVITGSGLSGTIGSCLLWAEGHAVVILEEREHVGGNCYDEKQHGVIIHTYGPHIFHTNEEVVWNFLSKFTEWTGFENRVLADTARGRISIPYNLQTQRQLGRHLTDEEIRDLIFKDYSRKQWGIPWEEMPAAITGRVPMRRENEDTRYFTDRFQGQPKHGYTAMFERMLEGIPVHLGVGKDEWRKHSAKADLVIYTGKIDEYFNYCYGRLPYRSLRFEHERSRERLPVAVINQCNTLPYTRTYDHRYFSEDSAIGAPRLAEGEETIITKEHPMAHDETNEPFYPMPFGEGQALYQKYKKLADAERRTIFIGRLATYSYLDMWMAVKQAMVKLRPIVGKGPFI